MKKKAPVRRKTTPEAVGFQYSADGVSSKGLIPLMNEMAELLPENMKPYGRQIAGTLNISVSAIMAIFMIGITVATLTGHSDQIMNIFAADIMCVGILAVASIAHTVKKTL
jgi:hypothetical protein